MTLLEFALGGGLAEEQGRCKEWGEEVGVGQGGAEG